MLGCAQVSERLGDAIDGELSPWSRLGVHLHLMMCHRCRAAERSLRRTLALLGRLGGT